MRFPHTAYGTGASLVLLLLLSACAHKAVLPRAALEQPIQLQVIPERGDYRLQKSGRLACPVSRPEGCIKVAMGNTAKVTFKLNAGKGWHLTKFTLCRQSGDNPCSLTLPERADFEFTVDGTGDPQYLNENGELNLSLLADDLKEFVLTDRNTVTQSYEYSIEACDADNCTTMDPPLENGGLE